MTSSELASEILSALARLQADARAQREAHDRLYSEVREALRDLRDDVRGQGRQHADLDRSLAVVGAQVATLAEAIARLDDVEDAVAELRGSLAWIRWLAGGGLGAGGAAVAERIVAMLGPHGYGQ